MKHHINNLLQNFKTYSYVIDVIFLTLVLAFFVARIFNADANFLHLFLIIINSIAIIPVVVSVTESLFRKRLNVDLLAAIALIVSLLANELYPALFINLMLSFARLLDFYTESRTKDAVKSLLKMRPESALIQKGTEIKKIDISQVNHDDIVILAIGERAPVDGVIVEGEGVFDLSTLTGESIPVEKFIGDEILSSSVLVSGNIKFRVTRTGKDTALEKIISLIEDSGKNKAEIDSLGEKFSQFYIFGVIVISILIYIATSNLNLVLSIILVICADDIAVAIPIAFVGGIRSAARFGVVIKGAKFLEGLGNLKTLVVDKTGTLTKGKLIVEEIVNISSSKEEWLKSILNSLTSTSTHPVAKAINKFTRGFAQKIIVTNLIEKKAKGITGQANGNIYYLGKFDSADDKQNQNFVDNLKQQGFNVVVLTENGKLLCIVKLRDEPKSGVNTLVKDFRDLGVSKIVMLTGDNQYVAESIAKFSGIDEFHANLLPEEKIDYIKKLKRERGVLAMIGDGVNDAASLKLADIGISMGSIGSDSAIDASDIIIIDDDLKKLKFGIALSRFIKKISVLNFIIWGVVNVIGLTLVFTGILNPVTAALYNFLTDFIPLLNSFRAFWYKND